MSTIPFDKMMDLLMTMLTYWSESWNNLNVPLIDWIDPELPFFSMIDAYWDKRLIFLGIADFTLLEFVLGAGIFYLLMFTVIRWVGIGLKFS